MDIFNNTAGDLLIAAAAQAGAWVGLGAASLLTLLSLVGRKESRRSREN